MSKRVIAFALAAVAVIAVWWWRSSDSSKTASSDPTAEATPDRDRTGYTAATPTPELTRLRSMLSGDGEQFAPTDADGNPILIKVTGTVFDVGSGGTVPDAEILFDVRGRSGAASATSGADGTYSVELTPGLYSVTAIAAGRYPMADTLRLTNKLREAIHDVNMAGFATVRGRVVDGAGAPVSGADVTFRSWFHGDKIRAEHVADYSSGTSATTTGSDGSFELDVIPGVALIEASVGASSARARIEGVAPGQTYDTTIVLDASAVLRGIVLTADGAPAAGATVRVMIRDSIKELSRRTATADDYGEFVIEGITPGRLDVDAHLDGRGTSQAVRHTVETGTTIDIELIIGDAATIDGFVVDANGHSVSGARVDCLKYGKKLPPVRVESSSNGSFSCAVSDGPHRIRATHADHGSGTVGQIEAPADGVEVRLASAGGVRGIVTTSDGEPVKSFAIRVIQARLASDGATRVFNKPGTPFSDEAGAYDLPLADAGTYHLVATAGQGQSHPVVVEVPSAGYGQADFVIDRGGTIAGVVRTTGGQPIAGASIRAPGGYTGKPVFSESDGSFELTNVAAGDRSVRVVRRGYVSKTTSGVEVRPGETTNVAFELQPSERPDAVLEYTGIGAVVVQDDGIRIVRLVKRGPAAKADMLVEDVIIGVDGTDIRGMAMVSATEMLRGPAGTKVTLEVQRGDEVLTVTIERKSLLSREYTGHVLV